jgi:hypothetical protein
MLRPAETINSIDHQAAQPNLKNLRGLVNATTKTSQVLIDRQTSRDDQFDQSAGGAAESEKPARFDEGDDKNLAGFIRVSGQQWQSLGSIIQPRNPSVKTCEVW